MAIRLSRLTRPVALAWVLFAAAPASAAEIKVLAYNAINIPARELAAAFSKETGHQVTFTFGSPGPVNERLKAGEQFDLVIAATEAAQARDALWRTGTRRPLVRVGIGLAVREGVTVDLSTVGLDPQGAARRTFADTQRFPHRRVERAERTQGARQSRYCRSGEGPARSSQPTARI